MTETDLEPKVLVRTLLPAAPRDGGVVDVLIQVIAPPGQPIAPDCTASLAGQTQEASLQSVHRRAAGIESADGAALKLVCGNVDVPAPLQVAEGRDVCWSSLLVTLIPSKDVLSLEPPSPHSSGLRPSYSLPDLRFGSVLSLLLRLHVGPSHESCRTLFSVKVRATSELRQEMIIVGGPGPELVNLDAEAMATLSEDEVVAAALSTRKGG